MLIAIYIGVIPFFTTPTWCLEDQNRWDFFTECGKYDIPYSNTLTINQTYLCIADMICVSIFAYGRWYRRKFDAVYEPHEKIEDAGFAMAVLGCVGSSIASIVKMNQPVLADLLRPFIVASLLQSVQRDFKNLMRDLWDSAVILGTIFIFIFFNANICWFLYQGEYNSFGAFSSI